MNLKERLLTPKAYFVVIVLAFVLLLLGISSVLSFAQKKYGGFNQGFQVAQPYTVTAPTSGAATTTEFIGSVLPQVSGLYDLGSITKKWRSLFLSDGFFSSGTITGTSVISTGTNTSTFAGPVSSTRYIAGNGSPSAPSFAFSGDENTGIFRGADGSIDFSTNGNTSRFEITTGQIVFGIALTSFQVGVNDIGTAGAPFGNIYASGTLTIGKGVTSTGDISPSRNNAFNLGAPTLSWGNIYASGTAFLPSIQIVDTQGVTTTEYVGTLTGKRGQICLGDQDGSGFTCLTGNNGVMTVYSTSTY